MDQVGRGKSQYLDDASAYNYGTYAAAAMAVLSDLGTLDSGHQVDWVGSSMGGLLGIMMAAKLPGVIRRLVLNDVGPWVSAAAIEAIGTYVGQDLAFASLEEATVYMKQRYPGFGPLTEEQWATMVQRCVEPVRADDARPGAERRAAAALWRPAGVPAAEGDAPAPAWRLAYDTRIDAAFMAAGPAADVDLWPVWAAAKCDSALVLHGAQSNILSADIAANMPGHAPGVASCQIITWQDCGHIPGLVSEQQILAVQGFLLG